MGMPPASGAADGAISERIRLTADDAAALDLPPTLHEWLTTTGLPVLDGETLGVTFQEPFRVTPTPGAASTKRWPRLLDIGYEQWEPEHLRVCIDLDTLAVVGYGPEPADNAFINSSIQIFITFLEHYRPVSDALNGDEPEVKTISAAEAARKVREVKERMEAIRLWRAGEGPDPGPNAWPKPKTEPKPRINRKKTIDELRDTFKAADPAAMKRGTYWPRIISQLRDGLI